MDLKIITKILVPIDGSELSGRAIDYALDLADKYSAEIVLFNVAQPIVITDTIYPIQPMMPTDGSALYLEDIEAFHKKIIDEALKKAKESKPNLSISGKLVDGRPAHEIGEFAKSENFDLIVLGSRGLGMIREFFLGGVSDRVADEAHCPVLLVK